MSKPEDVEHAKVSIIVMRDKARRLDKLIAILDHGLEIRRVHHDRLREQTINARIMDRTIFDRLKSNIENDS